MKFSLVASWKDPFLRKSAIFFVGSLIVAFLNYLYYPVLGRWLTLEDFGEVQAILALATQMTMILAAFTLATVHASVNHEAGQERQAIVRTLRRAALAVVAISFGLLLLSAHLLANTFQFEGPVVFAALAILLVTTTVFSTRQGVLQGQGKFFQVSIGNILVSAGRILFALLAIWFGGRAFGAVFGMVLAQLVALGFVVFITRRGDATQPVDPEAFLLTRERQAQELGYVAFVALIMAFVTALYNIDVLIVKHWFSPEIAGAYSGIATVAKIVFFMTSPFAAVLLSAIKRHDTVEHRRKIFLKAFLLVLFVGGGVASGFGLWPAFFVQHLMGSRYLPYAHLLPGLVLAFYFACLTNVNAYLGLALRRHSLIFSTIFGSVLLLFLAWFRHANLEQVVSDMVIGAMVAFVLTFGTILLDLRKTRSSSTLL
jgi:O-antigen/teichoic acid export membrane protein